MTLDLKTIPARADDGRAGARCVRNAAGCRLLAVLLAVLAFAPLAEAASSSENKAFETAVGFFKGQEPLRAEIEFARFTTNYPKSDRYAEAILLLAECRYQQGNFAGAIDELTAEKPRAGVLADQFDMWIAHAYREGGNYPAAANAYGALWRDYPASPLCLAATLGEAHSAEMTHDWRRVVDVLGPASGSPFPKIAQSHPADDSVVEGLFLLSEAGLNLGDFSTAEQALRSLESQKLRPEQGWRRAYLLCRVELAAGRSQSALESATNLLQLAAATRDGRLRAESMELQANILEQMDRLPEAAGILQANLDPATPSDLRNRALLRMIELSLNQGKTEEASKQIEDFLAGHPDKRASDVALLALGELRLKQYSLAKEGGLHPGATSVPGAVTNWLGQAQTNFSQLIAAPGHGEFVGKAWLDLGWCLWYAGGRLAESQVAFSNAVALLPLSEDRAVARFKLGDAQFQQMDFAGAMTNYSSICSDFAPIPTVRNRFCEQALYQMLRAALAEKTNVVAATQALSQLLSDFPNGPLAGPGELLLGRELGRKGKPAAARDLLERAVASVTNSLLLPEARLAIARTYELESNWDATFDVYRRWLVDYPNDTNAALAEFALAWAYSEAGRGTDALSGFTNFVVRHPADKLAPLAQYWVADHYWHEDSTKAKAELNYQEVWSTNRAVSPELAAEARMMAGRAAVNRESLLDALSYFTNDIPNPAVPLALKLKMQFAYADTLMLLPAKDTNIVHFREAIKVFYSLAAEATNTPLAALAWGRMGDCYFQLAEQDPAQYDTASNAYQQVIDSPLAGASARSQARYSQAQALQKLASTRPVAERKGLLDLALNHYLDVVYNGDKLREGEEQDPYWVQRAGLDAGQLDEELGHWRQADALYRQLRELLPSLRDTLDRKIARVAEHLTPR